MSLSHRVAALLRWQAAFDERKRRMIVDTIWNIICRWLTDDLISLLRRIKAELKARGAVEK